jgi:hypothetical protein
MLTADKLQAGDCLRGSNLELNIQSAAWPQYAQAVPCNQAHTAEVIYAGYAWPAAEPFPGTQTIDAQSAAKCEAAFREYVGLPQAHSAYSLINLAPADTSSWQSGDRSLQCVAWQATTAAPAGAPLYGSIWGTHR